MSKVSFPMISLVVSIVFPTGAAGAVLYYLNHEFTPQVPGGYLTVYEYKLAGAENNVQRLQEQIDSLQYDVDAGYASDKDKWLLQQKKQQLQMWLEKISKLKQGRVII